MLKTYKKYCNFDNLPNHFIVIFKRLSTCDQCMAHMLWLCRVVAMIEFVLYIQIQYRRMNLSIKNKFPNHILFPEIPTLFIVRSVLNLFTLGAADEYRARKIFKHVIEYLHVSNFQRLTNQISCYYSYWFRIKTSQNCHISASQNTVKGFNFAVLKFRDFLDGDLSRWFKFRGIWLLKCTCNNR